MRDASLTLLDGVRKALIADANVSALIGSRIASSWSHVLAPPYARIRVARVDPWEVDGPTASQTGGEHRVTVHLWTKESAPIVLHDLAAKVMSALQDNDGLSIENADMVSMIYDHTVYRPDADDPALQMAVLTFTATTVTA